MKLFAVFVSLGCSLVFGETFSSVKLLTPLTVSSNTEHKPQNKAWSHDGNFFMVMPISTGTWIFRLQGSAWTPVLKLSTSKSVKADVTKVGELVHILLFLGKTSSLATAEYTGSGNYQAWSVRPSNATVVLDSSVEVATLDVDSRGRMWIVSDAKTTIMARYSDVPYSSFSAPITIASGIGSDDISAVTHLAARSEIGVFWSNQKTKRFGFRTHVDGADPTLWSIDEVPASSSALRIGGGMADDHIHMAAALNGFLYVAVKTSYDSSRYPLIALLVRRHNGVWDPLHHVASTGTRPIVVLNERLNRLSVVYPRSVNGGDIVYRQSDAYQIEFGPQAVLIPAGGNNPTSARDPYSSEGIILSTKGSSLKGAIVQ